MFTEQVGMLETLRANGHSPDQITTLRQVLGNCEAPLAHRGPISIMLDGTPSPTVPMDTEDEIFAALRCYNCESNYDEDEDAVNHGFAADFCGVVRIRPTLRATNIFVENINVENISGDTIITEGSDPISPQYPGEAMALLGPLYIYFTVTAVHSQTSIEVLIESATVETQRHVGVDAGDTVGNVGSALPVYIGDANHWGPVAVGDKGVAHWCQLGIDAPDSPTNTEQTNCFLVVELHKNVGRGYAKATAGATVEGATTAFSISGFVDLGGGGLANGSVTTATNPLAIYITNGDALRLMYNAVDAVWEVSGAAQHVEEMVESVDKSGTSLRYQHKTISINRADDTTDNTPWHTTTTCP